MTRTFITGATGFTARYFAPLLASLGHEVHGLIRCRDHVDVPGLSAIHECDLTYPEPLRSILDRVRPHHIVHLAAISFVAHSDIEQMYRTNVVGTRQLLEALTMLPEAPRSVLLASSANVYGNKREGMLDEAMSFAPVNDYGVSKVAMEYIASLYAQLLPIIVVRPFNYTGLGQSADFIIPKIVAHARATSPTVELGNIDVARDFSDVRTVVDAYVRLLTEPQAIGESYNVCSSRAVSLKEVLDLVAKLSGHHLDVKVNPDLVRPNEVRYLCGSAAKLQATIGPLESIPLEETLRWMLGA
jgi:nucleoside-diphosphate-sugar epimerase